MIKDSETNLVPPTSVKHFQYLLNCIEEQHKIIDMNLTRPAKWRGRARREYEGRIAPDVCKRLSTTYNNLIEKAVKDIPLDVELLLDVHKDLVDGGGLFRSKGVKVGKKDEVRRPHSSKVSSLVEQALERAEDNFEPPPLAASRLHLELLIIHPFADGNGRISRLMASYQLMRASYYSTLLATVEQHFQIQPSAYARTFRILRSGKEKNHAPWLITALEAMLFNSMKACWFRKRQGLLFEALKKASVSPAKWTKAAIEYDLLKDTSNAETLSNAVGSSTFPMITLAKEMEYDELKALVNQIERLYVEEQDERCKSDEYTWCILDSLKELM